MIAAPLTRSTLIWPPHLIVHQKRLLQALANPHGNTDRDSSRTFPRRNNGKPLANVRNGDLVISCETLRYTARWATKLTIETLSLRERAAAYRSLCAVPADITCLCEARGAVGNTAVGWVSVPGAA